MFRSEFNVILLVEQTCCYQKKTLKDKSTKLAASQMTVDEIYYFIALIILMGSSDQDTVKN
jgi:hypothetical protein